MKHDKHIDLLLIILTVTFILMMIASVCLIVCMVKSTENDTALDTPDTSTNDYKKVEPYYHVTSEERDLLARIVTCEADEYSVECQRAVASVIFNRLDSGKWQKDMNSDNVITVYDIIYYPNAFTPVIDGALDDCANPSDSAVKAVDYVIQHGPTIPEYVRYFRDYKHFTWQGYKGYTIIDDMYFGYFEDWKNGAW